MFLYVNLFSDIIVCIQMWINYFSCCELFLVNHTIHISCHTGISVSISQCPEDHSFYSSDTCRPEKTDKHYVIEGGMMNLDVDKR